VGHDASLIVVHVGESVADTLDLFNDSVEALGSGVGDPLCQSDLDSWPQVSMVVARRVVSSKSAWAGVVEAEELK
jgi:hypothetical protein